MEDPGAASISAAAATTNHMLIFLVFISPSLI
jgi:hypothetical protein